MISVAYIISRDFCLVIEACSFPAFMFECDSRNDVHVDEAWRGALDVVTVCRITME